MLGSSVLSLSIYSNVSVVLYIFLFFNIFCVASLVWFQFLNFCVPLKFYGMYLVAPLVNSPLWGGVFGSVGRFFIVISYWCVIPLFLDHVLYILPQLLVSS